MSTPLSGRVSRVISGPAATDISSSRLFGSGPQCSPPEGRKRLQEGLPLLLHPTDVAGLLGIGLVEADDMIAAGELPVARVGRIVGVHRDKLLAQLDDQPAVEPALVVAGQASVEQWLTVGQVAREWQLSSRTVYDALRSGRMQGKKFGRNWRTKRGWVEAFGKMCAYQRRQRWREAPDNAI